jgi:hypothetical protein
VRRPPSVSLAVEQIYIEMIIMSIILINMSIL